MERKKFQLSQLDLLPEWGKISSGMMDANGADLCYGDCVILKGKEIAEASDRLYVAFRYGEVMLMQPGMGFCTVPQSFTDYVKQPAICASFIAYTMIGHTDDKVYAKIKHLEHKLLTPQ